ncbi:DNA replication and repair protein RecF, partial [Klebsiella oxytoca]
INCLLGNNGMGKSNLLDAIHFLSFAKSFSRLPDAMLIRRGEDFGIINGHYERHGADEEINVGLRRGARKSFRRGGK